MSTDLKYSNAPITDECVICLEQLILHSPDLWQCEQCRVKIHNTCINNLAFQACPCCRKEFVNTNQMVVTMRPVYNTTEPGQMNFYIYNEIFKEIFYKGSIFMVICLISVMATIGCVFFILPVFAHAEEIYNITTIK
uniref:RING-type domain-containing protein n=1 Tax=viral metagenome TaxID=1070528 RepID=A0A6C0B2Q8_9ZZZZ